MPGNLRQSKLNHKKYAQEASFPETNRAKFTERATLIHGEKYDYSNIVYVNARTPVDVFCNACERTWPVSPYSHAKKNMTGTGCRWCAGHGRTIADLKKAAKLIHGESYDLSETIFINSKTSFEVRCKKHDRRWKTTWHRFITSAHGCRRCGAERQQKPINHYIEKFRSVHGDKYDYSLFTKFKGWHDKINIICKIHPETPVRPTPASHYFGGQGCKKCGYEKLSKLQKFSTEDWIAKAETVHGNYYDYSESEYRGDKKELIIICPKHGTFRQRAGHHTQSGSGCEKCHHEKIASERSKNYSDFITEATEIHMGKYTYTETLEQFSSKNTEVNIFCPIEDHGFFEQNASNHTQGKGCPKCKESVGEREIRRFLLSVGLEFESQKKFPGCRDKRELPFDFFVERLNLLIEYDGEQHYVERTSGIYAGKFAEIKRRDNIKNKFAASAGFNFLRIRWDENIITRIKETLEALG